MYRLNCECQDVPRSLVGWRFAKSPLEPEAEYSDQHPHSNVKAPADGHTQAAVYQVRKWGNMKTILMNLGERTNLKGGISRASS